MKDPLDLGRSKPRRLAELIKLSLIRGAAAADRLGAASTRPEAGCSALFRPALSFSLGWLASR